MQNIYIFQNYKLLHNHKTEPVQAFVPFWNFGQIFKARL